MGGLEEEDKRLAFGRLRCLLLERQRVLRANHSVCSLSAGSE